MSRRRRHLSPEVLHPGMVLETGGGRYRVRLDSGPELEAALRGRLKQEARTGDRVVIGDRVEVGRVPGDGEEAWVIESVEERSREIVRRGAHIRRAKVMAANVDRMIIVIAARDPEPRTDTVDRLLVIAESNGIEARIVVNKLDLPGAEQVAPRFLDLYPPLGYPTLATSAESGLGIEVLEDWVEKGISALIGPSGVGKSSLLNAIDPGLALQTGALSRKLARGRHTTVSARLIPISKTGWVADTPGFGDVGVWGADPETLSDAFPEFAEWAEQCRFRGCSHIHEPGCGVRAAVEEGEIAASRLESYVKLHAEAEESSAPDWG